MYKNNKHIKLLLTTFALVLLTINTNAQEVDVVDKKGTIQTVNNNTVTTSTTAPTTPVENDIWFDTNSTPNEIKIWDGTVWKSLTSTHTGTTGSVFFAAADGSPTENNSQFFWDNTNNRLRIGGALSGTNKVTVQGVVRSQGYNNSDGTVGQPAYRFSSDSDIGMYRIGTNQLGFSTNGTNALSIDASQNISIGANLSVTGTYADSSTDVGTNGQILSSTGTGTNWIDNTKNTVNTSITESTPADYITANPTYTPIENDTFIYKPTTGEKVYYIYDGTEWNMIAPTKASRIFYPPSVAIPMPSAINGTDNIGMTYDLYGDYSSQFSLPATTSATSTGAPSIPTAYLANELWYYVTYFDPDIFENVSIDAAGEMTYDVKMLPTDDNTIINVVFVVK